MRRTPLYKWEPIKDPAQQVLRDLTLDYTHGLTIPKRRKFAAQALVNMGRGANDYRHPFGTKIWHITDKGHDWFGRRFIVREIDWRRECVLIEQSQADMCSWIGWRLSKSLCNLLREMKDIKL